MSKAGKAQRVDGSHGFTLIELLLVVVIMGVLAAIVVFAVGGTTSNAAANACRVEAHVFQVAVNAAPANNPPVALDGNKPKTDASNLAAGGLLASSTLRYLDATQPSEPGTYATGWTYANKRVTSTGCA